VLGDQHLGEALLAFYLSSSSELGTNAFAIAYSDGYGYSDSNANNHSYIESYTDLLSERLQLPGRNPLRWLVHDRISGSGRLR
jgi:hypothetical protein